MSIRRKIILAFIALIMLGALGLFLILWPPLPLTPKIGQDLPDKFADANTEFQQRVFEQFPLPIKADELSSRLEAQGFSINPQRGMAHFEKQSFPCRLVWTVSWKSIDGAVVELNAHYFGSCL